MYSGPERRKKPRPRVPVFTCPECQATGNKVIDSRGFVDRDGIRRRRECLCGYRFTTYEYSSDHKEKSEHHKPLG